MTNFIFLKNDWSFIYENAIQAEKYTYSDPKVSCFYSRITLETTVKWLFNNDSALHKPYDTNLGALINEPTFKNNVGQDIFLKVKIIQAKGNQASHEGKKVLPEAALNVLKELYHFLFWFYRTYTDNKLAKMAVALFNAELLKPKKVVAVKVNIKELQEKIKQQDEENGRLKKAEEEKELLQKGKDKVENELKQLQAEIQKLKEQNLRIPDEHDYNEAETRDFFINLLIEEAGWNLHAPDVIEYPVIGMPTESGNGLVDYVLWGDDGLPLAVVEAKRCKKDPRSGQQQAKLYADCLEKMTGQRPVIFYTNGYETYIWDDLNYPPRMVHGFYKKEELQLLINRRKSRGNISIASVNKEIAGRYYQIEAIKRVTEDFYKKERKALLVMATGTGKTRVAIALTELLQKSNWVKRVLFLADRNALLNQARKNFLKYLPHASPEIISTKSRASSRISMATYPTMMNCIDKSKDGTKDYAIGHFDLIIIDEAHRSVYHKYRAIFDYFDSLIVGLTATPRAEVDKNTYSLFDLEDGVPTYYYESDQAYKDAVLVPPKAISVPLKFQREGIKYSDLSPEEQEEYEVKLFDEETGEIPEKIEPGAINQWLFNEDTVDKVLRNLMEKGLKVEGGDRLGKTIIFAKNHNHAEFIEERFNVNYPHFKGAFARVIDNQVKQAQSIIDDFYQKNNDPVIAISVDMMDTGIDVPEAVNLVFFKIVRSKVKFHQMIGRGTRLCLGLFGPSEDKEYFLIFDYCQNFEFFEQFPEGIEPPLQESLSKKIFKKRLALAIHLQNPQYNQQDDVKGLKTGIVNSLVNEVSAMNVNNFFVRPKREYIEKYSDPEKWQVLTKDDELDLTQHLAGLPSELPKEHETAKQFDLMLLSMQLALLESSPLFAGLKDRVIDIAARLEELPNVPMVQKRLSLIIELQTEDYWTDITLVMLEEIRKSLRDLIIFIDKEVRPIIYTKFIDEVRPDEVRDFGGFAYQIELKQYKKKVEQYIREHDTHITIHKLKNNRQITPSDLSELEKLLFNADEIEDKKKFEQAFGHQDKLGLFIRQLVGLDRQAAIQAFDAYLNNNNFSASQIRFINKIIDYLTQNGVMNPRMLYEPPFTEIHDDGIDGIFQDDKVDNIIGTIQKIEKNAVA